MNTVRNPLAFLLATAVALAGAHAQAPVTRAQVIADYQDAVRTGDLLAPGDSGMKLNELYPARYPKAMPAPAPTRAQIVDELHAAIRSGDVPASGDSGMKENELHPQRYPSATLLAMQGKSREQVRAETLEAIRTGDIFATGESGLKLNELFPRRYDKALTPDRATRRAVAATTASRDGNRIE